MNLLNWLPLLVVIIGAYLTYFYASRLEDKRNLYNLKTKIFLDVLEQIQSLRIYVEKNKVLEKLGKNDVTNKEYVNNLLEIERLNASLLQHIAKLPLVCNSDVMMNFNNLMPSPGKDLELDRKDYAIKILKLSRAMRKDLSGKEENIDWLFTGNYQG